MTQATISISGVGHVEIDTERGEIQLVRGGWTNDGAPVDVVPKRVYRNKKYEREAARNQGVYLREVQPGYFEVEGYDD